MSENRFINALKNQKSCEESTEDMSRIISKMKNRRKLSTHEFQRVYDLLHADGPRIKYQNTSATIGRIHQTSNSQSNLQNF